jgi:hypothetical protein
MTNLLTYINNGELKAGSGYCYTEPKTKKTFPAALDGERGLFIFKAHGKKHEVKSPTKYVGICTPSYQVNGWLKILYNGVPIVDLCKSRKLKIQKTNYMKKRKIKDANKKNRINLAKNLKKTNDRRGVRIEKLLGENKDIKEKYILLEKEYSILQKKYEKLCVVAVDNMLK